MELAVKGLRVLVIVAHPDDETIGCGATLARLSRAGATCRVLLAFRRTDARGRDKWSELIDGFRLACSTLGCEVCHPLDLPETGPGLDLQPLHDAIVGEIEASDMVLTHWGEDTHQAHRALACAVEIGSRPFRRRRDVLQFEIPTSTDQGFRNTFVPNCCVALDKCDVEIQERALACYPMEHAPGRSPKDLTAHAAYRGRQHNLEFAQVFYLARSVWSIPGAPPQP